MDNCTRITLIEAAKQIGEGDPAKGLIIIHKIAERLEHARVKHPVFAESRLHASHVCKDEFDEFINAVIKETPERQDDEALDVIATCIRFLGSEYEH